ncbi:lcl3 [Ecytonucleospora hepatopenaei]|uniref:Lcl3 n=1 Tax=Ecytonucleospora hepatopenaei TaxID=646526 RepID=A0A1W0E847_9MICR|nr:hypothetical protein EHP00_2556 [Ecytonucleospora hepatopenaei]OQS55596.1 lcl3 [Ecytonucleospora hepatopenaei]
MTAKEFVFKFWYFGIPIVVLLLVGFWLLVKRYTKEEQISIGKSFSVIVTRVGDGDGFKAMHTPWFRSKQIFDKKGKVQKNLPLLSFRLAGVDAPEVAAFGKPAQPFAKESTDFLKFLILYRVVQVKIVGKDMYGRLLAMVYTGGFFNKKNVNDLMLKTGMACVYVGAHAKYGGRLAQMKALEKEAKANRLGMWSSKNVVTPMEHKAKYR